jgi:Flp pilus assembly protein TadD
LQDAEQLAEHGLDAADAASLPLWLAKAALASARGDLVAAHQTLQRARSLSGGSFDIVHADAQLLIAEGKREDAVTVFKGLSIDHPEDAGLAFELARLLIDLKRMREARDVLSRVSPFIATPQVRAEKMVLEGTTFEAERSWARAVSSYKSAARLAGTWPAPHFQAAHVYEQMGKFDEAEREVFAGVAASGQQPSPEMQQWIDRLRTSAATGNE